ncbi:MAG: response regulator [Rhodospirillales bacterium]|nr:response regulator [Alphaproteobacteria bacterium]MCB1840122.1 response regulator [Alphaproteobacteria bacterium]MCB9976878.1 response regulator [Rhodospirillales bacterium]
MRVLVIEDDKIIGDGIVQGLGLEDYAVDWVEDVESAETALDTNEYGLIVLDIGLPDGSGFQVLKNLRSAGKDIPVLMLTAYDDLSFKVKGLDSGADDYLIKPFKLEELLARLRALRRRAGGRATPILDVDGVTLDPATKKVAKDGEGVSIGPKEFAILQILMENKGKVLTKAQIEDRLYGWDMEIESNTVEVHIHGLRKKLGKDFIETLRHVGYRVGSE